MDEGIEDEGPRHRRLVIRFAAVIFPVIIFVGGAAWFIRAFVAPPMVKITDAPLMVASAPVAEPEPADATPVGTVQTQAAPVQVASAVPMLASVSYVPFALPQRNAIVPAPPRQPAAVEPSPSGDDALAAAEPIAGPIPLPRARPRISRGIVVGAIPLPRPRPQTEPERPSFPFFFR